MEFNVPVQHKQFRRKEQRSCDVYVYIGHAHRSAGIVFELLSETQPRTVDNMDELTSFFEHTYIRGRRRRGRATTYSPAIFPVETWNQHAAESDGIARSTNSVEGWHHGLQSLFQCHHPTVWTFMSGIQRDIQRQKALFLQATTGVSHPSAKKLSCTERSCCASCRSLWPR